MGKIYQNGEMTFFTEDASIFSQLIHLSLTLSLFLTITFIDSPTCIFLTLFKMCLSVAAWMGGAKKPPPPPSKICHTYPAMKKLATVIP